MRKIVIVGALIILASWAATQAQSTSLRGAWRVTGVTVTGANPLTNNSPQPGLFIFTDRHYSIVTVNSTSARKPFNPPKDPARLTDAEMVERFQHWNPVTANAGTYTVKGSTLTTRPLVAKNHEVMTGPEQTREFKIDGNTLTLIQRGAGPNPNVTTTVLTRAE
jgi:hypothetical protein